MEMSTSGICNCSDDLAPFRDPKGPRTLVILLAVLCLGAPPLWSGSRDPQALLPAPSGPFRLGTRVLAPLVDKARPDDRFVRGFRTIPVQLWYPTSAKDGVRALYIADSKLLDFLKSNSSAPEIVESWRNLRTHAIENAPIEKGLYPLVIFSPGFGMARAYYTSWIEELASHGMIVAAVDHPFAGDACVDGRILAATPHPGGPTGQTGEMVADIRFVVSALRTLPGVDKLKVAAIGHSIGGAAALDACHVDSLIVTCVNLDGDPSFGKFASTGVGRPFLVIHQKPVFPGASPNSELARIGRELETTWQDVIAKQSAPAIRLSVRGTGHLSFTDAIFTRPDVVKEGGGELTDPLLVLHGTVATIVNYLRNSFDGHPQITMSLPDFIGPAKLGNLN
jgi:pimeloyl-ACP methyl ester carboxylesterase